jgi:ubiquitin-activating enzyme E1
VRSAVFEKDDDANGHVAFVTAASNLRAANYGIEPADEHQTKLVAGRIVPALATTTAAVVGLVGVELLKLVASPSAGGTASPRREQHRNAYLNLALPLFAVSEPEPAEEFPIPGTDETWCEWSRIEMDASAGLSLRALVEQLEARLRNEVSLVECEGLTLYSSLAPVTRQAEWSDQAVGALAHSVCGVPQSARHVRLSVSLYDEEEEEDVPAPPVVCRLRRV